MPWMYANMYRYWKVVELLNDDRSGSKQMEKIHIYRRLTERKKLSPISI